MAIVRRRLRRGDVYGCGPRMVVAALLRSSRRCGARRWAGGVERGWLSDQHGGGCGGAWAFRRTQRWDAGSEPGRSGRTDIAGGPSRCARARALQGEAEPVDPVAGHIPGARNLPATEMVQRSGAFCDRAKLRALFATAGAAEGAQIGAYCGSGVTAAHAVLALELAGLSGALYPGSWSEWITDPRRPVARGA